MKHLLLLLCVSALLAGSVSEIMAADDTSVTSSPVGTPNADRSDRVAPAIPRTYRDRSAERKPLVERPSPPSIMDVQKKWVQDHANTKDVVRNKYEAPDITHTKLDSRACANDDIMGGVWKMIYYREEPARQQDKFNRHVKYQYLNFNTAHYYARVKSATSIDDPQVALRMMSQNPNEDYAQKYILNASGETSEVIFMSGKNAIARQGCSIVLKPTGSFAVGDMVLQGYTQEGKILLYELYRRWF